MSSSFMNVEPALFWKDEVSDVMSGSDACLGVEGSFTGRYPEV